MRTSLFGLALAVTGLASPAMAKDGTPCLAGMVCASDPKSIVNAIQAAGYKAVLTKDDTGDPEIDSSASGYEYQIYFYDCEVHAQCASVQFEVGFKAAPQYTVAAANAWNAKQRLGRAYIASSGGLHVAYDLSTVGGINPAVFKDTVEWWASTLDQLEKNFPAQPVDRGQP